MVEKRVWVTCGVLIAGGAVLIGGCTAIKKSRARETESLLAAAGFQMRPADTPERVAKMEAMTPLKLVAHTRDGGVYYVYADPLECNCLYVGNEKSYQHYKKLAVEKQIAEEEQSAAMAREDAAMDWGMWGPWGAWGPGPY